MVAVGTKVFAAPLNAPMMLAMDTETDEVWGIDTTEVFSQFYNGAYRAEQKWTGIAAVGTKVYSPPYFYFFSLNPSPLPPVLVVVLMQRLFVKGLTETEK